MNRVDEVKETSPVSLDYATLDADGNPEFVPEAEAAIDRGDRPRSIAKHFRKRKLAKSYIVKSLRRRFGYDKLEACCIQCGGRAASLVTVEWQFKSPVAAIQFTSSESEMYSAVETSHTLCGRCAEDWFRSQRIPLILVRVSRWMVFIALAIYYGIRIFAPRSFSKSASVPLVVFLIAGIASAIIIGYIGKWWHRRTWPVKLVGRLPKWCKPHVVLDYCPISEVREHDAEET